MFEASLDRFDPTRPATPRNVTRRCRGEPSVACAPTAAAEIGAGVCRLLVARRPIASRLKMPWSRSTNEWPSCRYGDADAIAPARVPADQNKPGEMPKRSLLRRDQPSFLATSMDGLPLEVGPARPEQLCGFAAREPPVPRRPFWRRCHWDGPIVQALVGTMIDRGAQHGPLELGDTSLRLRYFRRSLSGSDRTEIPSRWAVQILVGAK